MKGDLRKLGVIIDDVENMAQILYKLTEEYDNIVENIEDDLYEKIDMLNIKRVWVKLLAKYNKMNAQYNQNKGK